MATKVRAKFQCVNKLDESNGNGTLIVLEPVVGGSPENDKFFKYTPGGNIHLNTINEEAAKLFLVGQEYYVDFTPAE